MPNCFTVVRVLLRPAPTSRAVVTGSCATRGEWNVGPDLFLKSATFGRIDLIYETDCRVRLTEAEETLID